MRSFLDVHSEFELSEDQYRYPHIDKIPGGYWAVLQHKGERTANHFAQLSNVSGLLRQGIYKWDGEVDLYALAMLTGKLSPFAMDGKVEYPVKRKEFVGMSETFVAGDIELSDEQAKLYLMGQALSVEHRKGLCRLLWHSHPLGFGKSTGDRINNLIPKLLRAQR